MVMSGVSGSVSAVVAVACTQPLDVVRVRFQVLGKSGATARGVFQEVLKEHGVRGLYTGLIPRWASMVPSVGMSFFTYEAAKWAAVDS